MGLNVKLYNITNDGPYSIRYKSGPNPYPEYDDTSYTLYGTGLTSPSIILTGLSFDTQYWIKMLRIILYLQYSLRYFYFIERKKVGLNN